MNKSSLPPRYFDDVYAANPDPWSFATSEYEAEKYRRTLETLASAHFSRAFEIGCSIGVLTGMLADRCGHLLSVDASEGALRQARGRCAGRLNIAFERRVLPDDYPDGMFDLTVVSEVGYYLDRGDLAKLAGLIRRHTNPEGQVLLVHWLPFVEDYPLTGDQVHEYFLALPEWECLRQFKAQLYRIDLLQLQSGD